MAKGKDFINVMNQLVVLPSNEVQEEQEVQGENTQEEQEVQGTQGRKGLKAQRINMAFSDQNIDFIRVHSKIQGLTMTQFVNEILDKERQEKEEITKEIKGILEKDK